MEELKNGRMQRVKGSGAGAILPISRMGFCGGVKGLREGESGNEESR
jgi:hypothetical protein